MRKISVCESERQLSKGVRVRADMQIRKMSFSRTRGRFRPTAIPVGSTLSSALASWSLQRFDCRTKLFFPRMREVALTATRSHRDGLGTAVPMSPGARGGAKRFHWLDSAVSCQRRGGCDRKGMIAHISNSMAPLLQRPVRDAVVTLIECDQLMPLMPAWLLPWKHR
jgi:hypothetical protein